MIDRLEELHSNRVIHEDIKPQNATIGLGDQSNLIYMIDFGISEFYQDREGNHIDMSNVGKFVGTLRYASVNSH